MKNGVWQIAAGVFIGNTLFLLVAWFLASIIIDNARYDAMKARLPAQSAEVNAELAEACDRYTRATGNTLEACP